MSQAFDWVPYTLASRCTLNAASTRTSFDGALVRKDGGYGCLHPWPELGDWPLPEELAAFASGIDTRLTTSTRRCAALDASARREGRWLFDGLTVPDSHATITELNMDAIVDAERLGYRIVKVKASPLLLKELALLLETSPLPVRIDFNSSMTSSTWLQWHASLSPVVRAQIDFVEDPTPYDAAEWRRIEAATHCHFAVDAAQSQATDGFHVRVLKPAAEDTSRFVPDKRPFLVTSYMDHPLGQLFAAYEAARLAETFPHQIITCGLATHGLFELPSPDLDLGCGPQLSLPPGTGLGLDDYLEALPWQPWCP